MISNTSRFVQYKPKLKQEKTEKHMTKAEAILTLRELIQEQICANCDELRKFGECYSDCQVAMVLDKARDALDPAEFVPSWEEEAE